MIADGNYRPHWYSTCICLAKTAIRRKILELTIVTTATTGEVVVCKAPLLTDAGCDVGTDTQPPRVDRCRSPPAFTLRTADDDAMMAVSWEEPLFSDNSHGPVSVSQSHRPPAEFSLGTTRVHYIATDRYDNNATCVIDIVVQGLVTSTNLD